MFIHEQPETPPMRQFLEVLRRRRLLVLGCTVLVMAATAGFTYMMAPVFGAAASVRIDDERGIGPLAAMSSLTGERDLGTEVEMLRSNSLAAAVIDSLDLQVRLLHPTGTARNALLATVSVEPGALTARYALERMSDGRFALSDSTDAVVQTARPGEIFTVQGATFRLRPNAARVEKIEIEVLERREAIERFGDVLTVRQRGRDTRIVDVHYEDRDPALVVQVPNVLVSMFIADRQDFRQTEARSTAAFLREQIATISSQLTEAEEALRDFRQANRVISVTEQATVEVRREAELSSQLSALTAESSSLEILLAQVRREASVLGSDSSPYRKLVAFPSLLRNQAAGTLLGSLSAVEDRRADLLARRSPEDSDVQNLTTRIRALEHQLEGIAQTYLSGLQNQITSLEATLAQAGREMAAIPAQETRFAQLRRDAVVLETTYTQLQGLLKEAEIKAAVEDPSMRLVDAATAPREPLRPRPLLNLGLALIAGMFVGGAVAFGRERADKSVHSRQDVFRATGVPVLGFVPRAELRRGSVRRVASRTGARSNGTGGGKRVAVSNGRQPYVLVSATAGPTPFSEAYNRLDTNIAFAMQGEQTRVMVVTSPLPREGKTTSAVNFAITLAQQGRKVLLIDGDLRRGVLHSVFQIERTPGLADVLRDGESMDAALRSVNVGGDAVLHVLPAGALPENPAHLIRSPRMHALLQHLRESFDMVIIDAPPLNLVTDAALLGAVADGVLIVARAGITTAESLSFTIEQLQNVGARVLGSVLNDIDFERDGGYDRSYQYHRHYKEYHVGV